MNQRKKLLTLAAVTLLLLPGCGFISRLKSRDEINKGVRAFSNQDYPTAIEHFKKSVELDPDFMIAYTYMATAYSAMFVPGSQQPENIRHARNAVATFEKVLEKQPDDINAIINIAAIYYQMGDYDQSRQWCRKILEKDPSNAEALYRIGVINFDISYKATGITGDLVESMTPEQRSQSIRIIAEGVKALDDAIKLKPNYFDAMHYLNLLYREEAKFAADKVEKNKILLRADAMALKALELERQYKEEQTTKLLKTKKEGQ